MLPLVACTEEKLVQPLPQPRATYRQLQAIYPQLRIQSLRNCGRNYGIAKPTAGNLSATADTISPQLRPQLRHCKAKLSNSIID